MLENNTKNYQPSENLKTIVLAIGEKGKATIDDLLNSTKKTRNCLVATASAKNNKLYITYTSKIKIQVNENEIQEQKATISLTSKGLELLQQLKENN